VDSAVYDENMPKSEFISDETNHIIIWCTKVKEVFISSAAESFCTFLFHVGFITCQNIF